MARQAGNKPYVSFVQGLITEASPLTFPENATISEDNFNLNRNGSRKRRLGVDMEDTFAWVPATASAAGLQAVSVHEWQNINDDPTLALLVVQVNNVLWFFDLFAEDISSAPKNQVRPKLLDEGNPAIQWQSAIVGGKLVIANGAQTVAVLSYDAAADDVSVSLKSLSVRDQWGVDDGLIVDHRPTELTANHEYNLLNQGWGSHKPINFARYIEKFKTDSPRVEGVGSVYPSNADLVQLGAGAAAWDTDNILSSFIGKTPAPKGHYNIDLFNRSESRKTQTTIRSPENNFGPENSMSGLTKDISTGGIKTVSSFAGRAWYAGIDSTLVQTEEEINGDERSPLLSSYVAFSQIVENESQLNKCYQEADPTAEDISDIVATDGGLIQIPEMSRCLKMINMGRSLVVIASNGVWEISGGEANFSATTFQVSKVSNVGALSAESIVDAEGAVFYWSRGGIYQLSYEQVSQSARAQNITETTIQGFLDAIPSLNKTFVQGSYDPAAKKVVWLFNDAAGFDGVTEPYKYNRKLTLDLVLSAFYPATFGSLGDGFPYVAGLFVTPDTVKTDYDYNLARAQDNVIVGTDNVVVRQQIRATTTSRTKYLAMYPDYSSLAAFSIAYEKDSDFADWQTIDTVGVDAPAFMITGYELLGDIQRDKQVPYLTMHFERTETGFEQNGDDLTPIGESSCRVQAQWDFANSATSGKYGDEFEAYRLLRNYTPSGTSDTFDYGYRVITTKTSLRGSGKALSLKLSSSAGKDLHVLGWAINTDGNTSV